MNHMLFRYFLRYLMLPIMGGSLSAAEPLVVQASYWKNDSFLKSFNGSYRVQANVEPFVEGKERDLFVSIQGLMAEGKREEALRQLEQSSLKTAAVEFNRGNLYFELGNDELAKVSYMSALEQFPSFLRAHRNLGFLYARQGEMLDAKEHFKESISLGDQNGASFGWLGHCYLEAGKVSSALQCYRMAGLTEPDVPNWKAGEAQCLQDLGDLNAAQVLLAEVVSEFPNESSYSLMQVELFLQLHEMEKAMAVLEWLKRKEKLGAQNSMLLADLHLRAGNINLAINLVESVLNDEEGVTASSVVTWLSNAHELVDWSRLDELFQRVSQYAKEELERTDFARVQAKHDAVKQPEDARRLYSELVKLNPLNAGLLFDYGQLLQQQGKLELSVIQLERVLFIDESHGESLLLLGQIYTQQGLFSKAVPFLKKAQIIDQSEGITKYLEAVEKRAALE